ncbi:roadblock/LC7 domain-containing protein [Kineosporia succinea]|uniref:Regulator of Ras-like GTPase activity (Roadblock/LC7/MglB family) n=1 Tax=Kineosporia succinea TaxID=84632 RepID=A0ABT9P6V1_9ACTN|nr:roadblock/LC7 domain-containing protein [Kineosporia succinea]MDP9828411.1 putative regulator of Ras-like GTPase activity (Roadblock/LC7/MglB family) [Kineosporia succinea]
MATNITIERMNEMSENTSRQGLDWLVDDLIRRLPGVEQAIVLSSDGLLIGRSRAVGRDEGEHLAAVASGFQSLARGTGRHFGGGNVRQTMVEMDNFFFIVTAAGEGACLALLADVASDLGMVAYEMNLLVTKVGTYLSSQPRAETGVEAGRR